MSTKIRIVIDVPCDVGVPHEDHICGELQRVQRVYDSLASGSIVLSHEGWSIDLTESKRVSLIFDTTQLVTVDPRD